MAHWNPLSSKSNKKGGYAFNDPSQPRLGHTFSVSKESLEELFDHQGDNAQLSQLGGPKTILAKIHTSAKHGLSSEERGVQYIDRIEQFGTNVLPSRKYKALIELMWDALKDMTLRILLAAAIVSIGLRTAFPNEEEGQKRETAWIEGASILAAVIMVTFVVSINDWTKDRQFRLLESEKDNDWTKVIREGEIEEVRVFDLVVGDIVLIDAGDRIPADGILLLSEHYEEESGEGKKKRKVAKVEIKLDQSNLTGESDTVTKPGDADDLFLFSGCTVSEGSGRMVVCAVGTSSQWGKIVSQLEPDNDQTPLQEDLDELAKRIGWIGLSVAAVVFIALSIWWILDMWAFDKKGDWTWTYLQDFIDYFIVGVTIIVVAIPEGLPLAVMISLAYSMKKMMKDNNLVRHLVACETMGCVTQICTDKTGTLTLNRMEVVRSWIGGKDFEEESPKNEVGESVEKLLVECLAINSKAVVKGGKGPGSSAREYIGNKTECAMLVLCEQLEGDWEAVRNDNPVIRRLDFSSDRKRMTSVVELSDGRYRVYVKGAYEKVLKRCENKVIISKSVDKKEEREGSTSASGGEDRLEIEELTDSEKNSLKEGTLESMTEDALRTIVVAYKDFDLDEEAGGSIDDVDEKTLEGQLTLVAILGIQDPLRPEVRHAVARCHDAGIVVRMVTGDNIKTATRIAKQCGIFNEGSGDIAMEAKAFRKLGTEQLSKTLQNLKVMARSTPGDKRILVKRLKQAREVVAVTGDGTNDAPALRDAHIGLAMGIEGTGVAKLASDIIIMDDNFASIVKSVMWGRNVRENIQKFLQFQLTVNVVALVVAAVAAISGKYVPLQAIQLLWVNLIMDTMGALALGTEPPTEALLDRPPVGRAYPLITAVMWRNIFAQSAYQLVVLFVILWGGESFWSWIDDFTTSDSSEVIPNLLQQSGSASMSSSTVEDDLAASSNDTFLFNTFVFCQIFNEINSRRVIPPTPGDWFDTLFGVFKGLGTNIIFIAVIVITVAIQTVIIEFGGDVMKTKPLEWRYWVASIVLGFGTLVVGAIARFINPPEILCARVQDVGLGSDVEWLEADSQSEAGEGGKIIDGEETGLLRGKK